MLRQYAQYYVPMLLFHLHGRKHWQYRDCKDGFDGFPIDYQSSNLPEELHNSISPTCYHIRLSVLASKIRMLYVPHNSRVLHAKPPEAWAKILSAEYPHS